MNGYKLLLMLLLAGIVFSCVREPEAPLSDGQIPQETYAPDDEGVLKGWVRIKLRDDAQALRVGTFTRGAMESGDPELDRIAASLGATEVRRVFHEGGRFAERRRKFGLHLWYDVKFDDTLPVSRAQAELGSLSAVAHVQPVYTIRMFDAGNTLPEEAVYVPAQRRAERAGAGPFDDPGLPKQWHYNNDGSGTKWVEGSDINLFEAWEVTAGDPSVIVAVTDHGVEYDHPDLAGNMWVNEAELNGTPGVDDDNNGYVDDIYGWNVILDSGTINPGTHGTHVAGTVAAVNNNGIGVCGVAGGTGNGDGARIMSLAIFDSTSANAGSYPDAYAYAADNGAVISQNSWGYTSGVAMPQDVSDALDYFIANAGVDENGNQTGPMKGGLLVFAAGNEGTPSARMPAADPRTLCVTAMCSDYTRPNYANYSDDVDIFAPGGADGNDRNYSDADRVYSTDLDGGYSYKWGTSMACPHVSGIAALVVAHYGVGHPGFTVEECREILLRSYRSVSEYVEPKYDGKLGVGLADAGMIFLEDAGTAPGTVSAPAARAMGRELELAWTVPADGNGLPVAEFRLTYTGRGIGKTEGKAPDTSGEVVLRNYTAVAETATYIWTGQYNTEYRFEVSGIDRFGHESEKVSFSHSTGDYENGKPRTQQDFAPVEFENVGEAYALSFDLSEYFTDPNFGDGDMLSYSLINRNEDIVDAAVREGRLVLLPVGKGTGRVTVTATDLDGEGVQSVLTVTVLNGPEPAAPAEGLRLSPNPAGDELGIAAGVRNAEVEVTVYDAAARQVIAGTVALDSRGYGTLNVSALAPGTYTLVLEAPGLSENGSFVKR
ncbi:MULTISPECIES: subtilase family N-terminal domain-containing protein [Rikenellaceae]|uniref:subtilase family N-terminal domain-containing protein n=1 Tax=Rikenellaceae TaxID=171550 RepID=UPI00068A9A2F|nr:MULTISPECIES: subtilase family N-terminal domain-containing protein [Rikenellaceae]